MQLMWTPASGQRHRKQPTVTFRRAGALCIVSDPSLARRMFVPLYLSSLNRDPTGLPPTAVADVSGSNRVSRSQGILAYLPRNNVLVGQTDCNGPQSDDGARRMRTCPLALPIYGSNVTEEVAEDQGRLLREG